MKPVSVLHVAETAKGGVGTCINLFSSFDPSEVHSHVVAPEQHADYLDQSLNITTFDRSDRGLGATVNMIKEARRIAKEIKPDVILCHSTFSLAVAAWFRLTMRGCPVIFCPHGQAIVRYDEGSLKHRIVLTVERFGYRFPTRVVHVSNGEQRLADKFGYPGQHVVIENALPDFQDPPRDDLFAADTEAGKTNILFVGRLDRQKGFDVLVDGVKQIVEERPDLAIHVVGASVNNDAELDDLPKALTMHGWVDNRVIQDWYRSADALIVPSRWEGLPFVIVEAYRCGTPVLVSDRSEMPDLVDQDRTGQVFHLDADDIARTLRALDREALVAMRPAARETYETRFHVDRFLNQYRKLLADLLPG